MDQPVSSRQQMILLTVRTVDLAYQMRRKGAEYRVPGGLANTHLTDRIPRLDHLGSNFLVSIYGA